MSNDFVPEEVARPGWRPRKPSTTPPQRTAEQRAADYFKASTRNHEMTVLHDDGVYRHIRCAEPGTGIWSWSLVTWPGYLTIVGDLESFTFSREHDMFDFFAHDRGRINPHYWAEKITNDDARKATRKFCSEKARAAVVEDFLQQRHYRTGEAADAFRDLRYHVLDQIEHLDETEFYGEANSWRYFGGWEFEETYEWDVQDWDVHYLYACHAIAWGVNKYRAAKEVAA